MAVVDLVRIALVVLGIVFIAAEIRLASRRDRWSQVAHIGLALVAGVNLVLVVFLVLNQISFPLHLDLMEGSVLQHVQRASSGQPIYPEPTPEYGPLAYNPLFYVLSIPFSQVFGVNLVTLRLLSLLGMVGIGVLIYRIIQEKTRSVWWGFIAVGLFAAAYRAMDAYLNTAHSDSWLVFSALLGCYIIDRDRSQVWNLVGVLVLVASFWFKQHGAMFLIAGVLYLTWRESITSNLRTGLLRSIPYWLTAILLGPALYLVGGPVLFGARFHYFTWEVPRGWSELSLDTFIRYARFIVRNYFVLALSGGALLIWAAIKNLKGITIWHFLLVFSALSGFMGALDPGSSDNVFITMGALFIIMGTLGLYELGERVQAAKSFRLHLLGLVLSFALFLYDPAPFVVSPQAGESYDDLVAVLHSLDGPVYGPYQAQLPRDYELYPDLSGTSIYDMTRGPGKDPVNNLEIENRLFAPVIDPEGPAYILTNQPLGWETLSQYYVLDTDFEDRFSALRTLPKRWDHGYPRYLYRYDPEAAAAQKSGG